MAKLKIVGGEPDLFSYAALSREDEASAREDAAIIRANVEDIAKKGIAIGQALNRQKAKMQHGTFTAWVRDECRMSERVAQRMMRVAKRIEAKAPMSAHLLEDRLGMDALDLLVSDTTPQTVRDAVEELLVDGQKVTVADIRRMKTEAQDAQKAVESLGATNADLAKKVKEKTAKAPSVDVDAIRTAAAREVEEQMQSRINDLNRNLVAAQQENDRLRAEAKANAKAPPPAANDETNVVRPDFAENAIRDEEAEENAAPIGKDAIRTFSGALGAMDGLEIDPAEFWKLQGRKGTHGKMIHRALLAANATIGLLIKEYAK